jgi:hypothetical protein
MAYKYKLVKEIEASTIKDIGTFIKSITIQPGNIPLEAMRNIFVEIPSSNNPDDEINTLDKGIRDILSKDGGFSKEDIEEYMRYLYGLRKNTVTSKGVPINEKDEDEDKKKKNFMKTAFDMAQKGNLDPTPKPEDNTYMSPEEHEERKKQGKKNLTKEVLRRLKNH